MGGNAAAQGEDVNDRDPRIDPQAGDILRGDGKIRRVIKRDGDMLICETWGETLPDACGSLAQVVRRK